MADAKVIPFDDDRSPRGRRARPSRAPERGEQPAQGRTDRGPRGPAACRDEPRPQDDVQVTRSSSRPRSPGSPDQPGRPPRTAAPWAAWERRVAGGLAFLRRRLTGDYEVDEFGYDERADRPGPDVAAAAAVREVLPGRGARASRTSRPRAARWSSPTTPGRCRWTA